VFTKNHYVGILFTKIFAFLAGRPWSAILWFCSNSAWNMLQRILTSFSQVSKWFGVWK